MNILVTGREPALGEADVRDEVALRDIFCKTRFDAVIHFAGLKAVGESMTRTTSIRSAPTKAA